MAQPITSNSISKPNILVVEDNLITSYHLKSLLTLNNYDVAVLPNATDLLNQIELFNPCAILMDIMLSTNKTGIEAAEEIRENAQIPIIFISALNDEETTERIKRIPNTFKQDKPFNEQLLLKMLKNITSK